MDVTNKKGTDVILSQQQQKRKYGAAIYRMQKQKQASSNFLRVLPFEM